jgi:hypothetical protein
VADPAGRGSNQLVSWLRQLNVLRMAHARTTTRDGTDAESFEASEELDASYAFIDRIEGLAQKDAGLPSVAHACSQA